MAETYTTNKSLAQVTPGTDSGTWGPFVNNNMGIADNSFGGLATVALTNSPVSLSSAQYQCAFINLTGALTGNVQVTFPGNIGSFYYIFNQTTNSSAFVVTLTSTSGPVVGLPPGIGSIFVLSPTALVNVSLPPVGTYLQISGSSVPNWIAACTTPPFLNCDGTSFSAVQYPALNAILGGNTLPDARGRALFALDQGTARNGAAFLAGGGSATTTVTQANLPNVNLSANSNPVSLNQGNIIQYSGAFVNSPAGGAQVLFGSTPSQITPTVTLPQYSLGGSGTPMITISPAVVHGLTLVRAG
jgi:hypothetical protein